MRKGREKGERESKGKIQKDKGREELFQLAYTEPAQIIF